MTNKQLALAILATVADGLLVSSLLVVAGASVAWGVFGGALAVVGITLYVSRYG